MAAPESKLSANIHSARERRIGRIGAVVWPAFLVAAALTGLVFSMVDPESLHGLGHQPLGWSDKSVYTLGFFIFWAACAAASAASQWLATEPPHGDGCDRS
jgi:hypothetical protein